MDRIIVYPGAIPLDTDMLSTNRNTMTALHALISATLGTAVAVDGLYVSATTPASMSVVVSQGSVTQQSSLDTTPYGTLGADTSDAVMKMGALLAPTTLTLASPGIAGTSVAYLIQASFSESDQIPVVLPYYNAANPAAPFLGPNNNGVAQSTLRQQKVALQLKPGSPAPTGYATVPPTDPGWTPLAVIVANAGATQINNSDITIVPSTRFSTWKLPDLRPGFAFAAAYSSNGTFLVPTGVTRLRVTVIGGGGAGGSHSSLPGGGGGAGGRGEHWLSGLWPGTAIPVTIGGGGIPSGVSAGGPGGSSSFGTYVTATGGQGGGGGGSGATPTGGFGGVVFGAAVYFFGGFGGDAVSSSARGGDGAGPYNGKGGSGTATGSNAAGFGGGGGGGAPGAGGGAGGGGLVIVEY